MQMLADDNDRIEGKNELDGPQTGVFTRDSAKAMREWDERNRKRP